MFKIKIYLFVIFLINSITTYESLLSIHTIESLSNVNYISPVLDNENNLYIISGESPNSKSNNFNRYILKYDQKGILVENLNFVSNKGFDNPEIEYFNITNDKYLLITTKEIMELYNIENNNIINSVSNDLYGLSPSLIKLGNNNYLYAYEQNVILDYYFKIKKISINLNQDNYNINFIENKIKDVNKEKIIISCDKTYDNEYIVCVYLKIEEKIFEIIAIDNDYNIKNLTNLEKSFDNSYFYKILYFKDNNKFVIVNSYSDEISHLRYYKYENNFFVNQLGLISDEQNDYINLENTQLSPSYEYNDIISINSTKLLHISTYLNNIIANLFTFYNEDSLLIVKTFKFKQNEEYNNFIHPKLSFYNNIVVSCLSTTYSSDKKAGFFFISYPTPINLTINYKSVKVKDIISIENNIFGFESFIKIVEIPEDFVFYNSLNERIKEGTYLYNKDVLILKTYQFSNTVSLKYQVLAKGDYSKYSSIKVYSLDSPDDISSDNEQIFIEGGLGNLNINIQECSGEFLPVEGKNMCSSITIDGYYLNKKEKMYKKCHSKCKTCFDENLEDYFMNCLECIDGYNRTEDTFSCYNELPENYYLEGNVFKRCSSNCTKCYGPEETNCLSCLENYTLFLYANICLHNDDIEKITIDKIHSQYRSIFISIFIISIVVAGILVFRPITKQEVEDSRYTFTGKQLMPNEEMEKEENFDEKEMLIIG